MKHKRPKSKLAAAKVADPQYPWWLHGVVVAGLLAASVALYLQALPLGFFPLDDPDYVINNPHLSGFTWANLARICTAPYFANFSPLHLISYMADIAVAGGKDPFALHVSSVLWNSFVVCMVYLLAFTLRGNIPTAAGAALLFLAHPAHVEVVAWISSRKDLVATGFGVLAMALYLLYRRRGKLSLGYYAGSILCFFLASAGKQSVVLLPAVMLLWDFLAEKRRQWSMVLDKIPFGFITILFALPTLGAQPDTRRSYDLVVLAGNQIWNFWLLTGLGNYVIYRQPALESTGFNPMGLVVIGLVASAWVVPFLLRHVVDPVRLTLWYWILVQLIPPMVFNFISPVTDRYLFLPSVGLCLLLADVISGAARRARGKAWGAWIGLLAIAGIWGGKTLVYLGEWNDPRTVWYAAATKSRAFQNNEYLGTAYQEAGERLQQFIATGKGLDIAKELPLATAVLNDVNKVSLLKSEWQKALQTPTNSGVQAPVWAQSFEYRDQLWTLAWEQFELAVARRGTINTPNLFMRRGMILTNRGKNEEAIAEFQFALRLARTHTYEKVRQENVTHITRALGVANWKLRRYAEARSWFLEAQRIQRESREIWVPTLDQEVEQIDRLAGNQPAVPAP